MIHYLAGDATQPQVAGPAVIAHVCNDLGAWGKGFVLAISRCWSRPEASYRKHRPYLGQIQPVLVTDGLWVVNMVAQKGLRSAANPRPLRYEHLATCLGKLRKFASEHGASVHMPRIGCGLAGGSWERIEPIILTELEGVDVYVYDLKS